jgi:hypothetical protein
MAQQAQCPVCSGAEVLDVLWRENLPLMQNVVFATREQAMSSSRGSAPVLPALWHCLVRNSRKWLSQVVHIHPVNGCRPMVVLRVPSTVDR